MPDDLSRTIIRKGLGVSLLEGRRALRDHIADFLEERTAFWQPVSELLIEELAIRDTASLTGGLAAWYLLLFASGPIDNLVDRDKVYPVWQTIETQEGPLFWVALVFDSLAALPQGDEPPAAGMRHRLVTAAADAFRGHLADRPELLDLDAYMAMTQLKTGAIYRVFFELFALAAQLEQPQSGSVAAFGEAVGCLIQIVDDAAGTWGSFPSRTGNDLDRQQVNLPVLFTLQALEAEPAQRAALISLLAAPEGERDTAAIRAAVDRVPSKAFMYALFEEWRGSALAHLETMNPSLQKRAGAWLKSLWP